MGLVDACDCNAYFGAGLYARFQPRSADFQKLVGEHVEPVLEAALAAHSTLSEGSWIKVPFGDSSYELLVQKLRPGRAVSVIGARSALRGQPQDRMSLSDA